MVILENKFGKGELYTQYDLEGKSYILCCACMSIYSEFLSWANKYPKNITKNIEEANNIIVLSCQVTDLAVLNDLKKLESLIQQYPNKKYYVGGCLAKRFDIELPINVKRLNNVSSDYQMIINKSLVDFDQPFWINDFNEQDEELSEGHLFRNMYPLRIGVGCHGKCKYCTINVTRGEVNELETDKLIDEYLLNDNVVLIADSPSLKQMQEWYNVVLYYKKPISIRNIEPPVVMKLIDLFVDLSKQNLLKILHCPVQSGSMDVVKNMGRDWKSTLDFISLLHLFKPNTILATNIIVDYDGTENNFNFSNLSNFDYISWNPYWDGKWDRKRAEERFNKYLGG